MGAQVMEFKVLMDKEKKTYARTHARTHTHPTPHARPRARRWASLGRLEIDLTNYSIPGSLQAPQTAAPAILVPPTYGALPPRSAGPYSRARVQTWELQLQSGDQALAKRLPKTVRAAVSTLICPQPLWNTLLVHTLEVDLALFSVPISASISIHLSTHLSVYLWIYLSTYLSIFLSIIGCGFVRGAVGLPGL